MLNFIFVGIGGFLGSVARYLLSMIPIKNTGSFPANTLLINVIGAFIIGIITALVLRNPDMDPRLVLLFKVGLCGGFTTFSTFSLETFNLIEGGQWGLAILYALVSVILCVAAILTTHLLVR